MRLTLIALLAIAASAALVPASAVALDDVNDGLGCRPGTGLPPGIGLNDAEEPCPLEGSGGGASDDEEPEEVIEIEGTAPQPELDLPPCLVIQDCLPPEIGGPGSPAIVPEWAGVEGPRGGRADSHLNFCRSWARTYREHGKELHALKLERANLREALRATRGWKNLEPSDGQPSGPTDLRPRDLEAEMRERLKEIRDEEKDLAGKQRLIVKSLHFNKCSVDVM